VRKGERRKKEKYKGAYSMVFKGLIGLRNQALLSPPID